MKQLELNQIYARLKTEHGIEVVVRELRNGDIRIVFFGGTGEGFETKVINGNIINIQLI